MENDFFVESVYRRFDAAIDRIDTRERLPTPHEAEVLTQVLDQIKAQNFERAGELLDAVNRAIVASSLGAHGDRPATNSHDTRPSRQAAGNPDASDVARTLPVAGSEYSSSSKSPDRSSFRIRCHFRNLGGCDTAGPAPTACIVARSPDQPWRSGSLLRSCACVIWLLGGTLCVSHTLPPMVDPRPIVMRPRMVAPA